VCAAKVEDVEVASWKLKVKGKYSKPAIAALIGHRIRKLY
jgi:hypothetical protein